MQKNNRDIYKKTFTPLIIWAVGFFVIMFATIGVLKAYIEVTQDIEIKIVYIICFVAVDLLVIIMNKGEYVYWITGGPQYEEAKKAGHDKRKKYLASILRDFFQISVVAYIYIAVSFAMRISLVYDMVVVITLLSIASYRMVTTKF